MKNEKQRHNDQLQKTVYDTLVFDLSRQRLYFIHVIPRENGDYNGSK